jgi:hypothetical protein
MQNRPSHDQEKNLSHASSLARARLPIFFLLLVFLVALVLIGFLVQPGHTVRPQRIGAASSLLPGQQIWKDNVSSFLFGTNDTQEWSTNNVETVPAIQQALKDAHFTVMRTFFFDKSLSDGHPTSDAEIDQRLRTIENSGMICLGVLEPILDPAFIKHVVSYAGNRCNMYEFANEADTVGMSMHQYVQIWNTLIPQLRKINPHAKFSGPVVADYTQVQPFLIGVKASGILPDAISFHWYPCVGNDNRSSCLAKTATFAQVTTQVKGWVREILGQNLPVGITEWNYNADNPPASYGQDPKFITQFSISALDSMIQAGLDFANQFDAASDAGFGELDMFEFTTGQPKPQYYAIKSLIGHYISALLSSSTTSAQAVNGADGLPFFPMVNVVVYTICSEPPSIRIVSPG